MKLRTSDLWLSVGLALAVLLTRLPFRSQFLYHWDSINFALSLEHYDVRLHQPHPPGYILYSMLGQVVNAVVHDGNSSLVWISLISGLLGTIALYALGTVMFDRQVGLIAALMALTNPLHWFYNEIALSYALEFLLVTLLASFCYLQLTGWRKGWLWLAVLLGIAGGVRQNDLVFLLPLWLVSLISLSWKQRLASLVILAVVIVAWLWPMIVLSGGSSGYLAILSSGSDVVADESPLFSLQQLGLNGFRMAMYLSYGLLLGIIPLLCGLWLLSKTVRTYLWDRRSWLFLLWIGPAACFYTFIHIRQPGHIFTFLPALFLLTALAITQLGQRLEILKRVNSPVILMVVLLLITNSLFFLLAPTSLLNSKRLPLQMPTWRTISHRDNLLGERLNYIKSHFKPENTVILANGLDFRHPDYYLRDYQFTDISYSLPAEGQQLPNHIQAVVLFTPEVESTWSVTNAEFIPQSDENLLPYFVRESKAPLYVIGADSVIEGSATTLIPNNSQ